MEGIEDRIYILFFCFAIVVTVVTKLRFGQIGPGEFLLITWMFLLCCRYLCGMNMAFRRQFRVIFVVFLSFLFLMSVCTFVSALVLNMFHEVGEIARGFFDYHTFMAFWFSIPICLFFFSCYNRYEEICLALDGYVYFLLLLLVGMFCGSLLFPELRSLMWYGRGRFTCGAKNPNQYALYLVSTPFILCFLLSHKQQRISRYHRITYSIAFLGVIILGCLSRSDALYVSWFLAGSFVFLVKIFDVKFVRSVKLWFFLLMVIGLIIIHWGQVFSVTMVILDRYVHGDPGNSVAGVNVRFLLWKNALKAMEASPIWGWGAGAFSGIAGPFEGSEAHNSILDWGMSTGVIGAALFVLWILILFKRVLKSRNYWLVGFFVSLFAFSQFHYVLRQPVFWFLQGCLYILSLGKERTCVE